MRKSETYYSKQSIARRYFPNATQATASRNLRDWLHDDRDLLADLKAEGYDKNQRKLTPRQYEIFVNYVNTPL